MKSIASVLTISALAFGLLGCPSSGGGGGGGSSQAFAVSTTAADFGVVDNTYTSTLATTGGTAPFTWTIFGGVLPNGLSLNAGMGVVSGTPDTAGTSTVDFSVTDSTGRIATGSVLFAIHQRTDRVSVNGSGTAGNGVSSTPSINGDGNLVAFVSLATNLLAPAIPAVAGQQVYVHNRQTNQIELISRDNSTSDVNEGNGVSSASVISADGRYVAFVSQGTNLLAPGTPAVPAGQQIYVRDRQTGLTSLVSVDNDPVSPNPGNGLSSAPSISADGRYVAFVSQGTNLLAPDPVVLGGQQIYVHDRQLGRSSLASQDNTNTNIEGAGGVSDTPSMNSDGSLVALFSQATNLIAGSGSHIYVRAIP